MITDDDLPDSLIERVKMMQGILAAKATGKDKSSHDQEYRKLRREFRDDPKLWGHLPGFVRSHSDLGTFWTFIKGEAKSYDARQEIIRDAFKPLLDALEGLDRTPADNVISTVLSSFDEGVVHAEWTKALERRSSDPAGAITMARTLLETVCKHVLGVDYSDKDDLPKLYGKVAKALNLAPDQDTEKAIKAILGGAMNVVNGIGTLRNKAGDSHGRGGKQPVQPSPRHASLAVNMAGTVAAFIIETHRERTSSD